MTSAEGRVGLQRHWAALGAAEHLFQGLVAGWQYVSIWRARQSTIAILQGLDDRTLKDIGIRRSEIESLVRDDKAERLLR
jgi:uncharacterized protein YjiS (DUF1127 family)